ncbi:MAG: hypothetical protein KatS3mg011_1042 [Acidimicrobiia bacterium]|nr:MAG: hypothetical protein KatS3mg011_1042 [Acidimicrobiia bacterium]
MEIIRGGKERGATMAEYGLMVGVIALLALIGVMLVGANTAESFDAAAESLDATPGELANLPGGGAEDGSSGSSSGDATTTTTLSTTTTTSAPAPTTTTTLPPDPQDSSPTVEGSGSELSSWKPTRNGGTGKWTASVTYGNDWINPQYLTLEVTTTDHKGKRKTVTVKGFYVPANGRADFRYPDNDLSKNRNTVKGVLKVEVRVVAVSTTDADGRPVEYEPPQGSKVEISAPPTP